MAVTALAQPCLCSFLLPDHTFPCHSLDGPSDFTGTLADPYDTVVMLTKNAKVDETYNHLLKALETVPGA